jgi:hypothetical protein
MASAVTITEQNAAALSVKSIKFDWTAHTDGAVTAVETTGSYTGKVVVFTTDPDAGVAPTASYDITIIDNQGLSVIGTSGTDRHTSNVEQVLSASLGAVVQSPLTFSVANAGSGGKGVAWVYIQ